MESARTQLRPARSVKLTTEEKKLLKAYARGFDTQVNCALNIGIDRNVLARVMQVGAGGEFTINKIREALNQSA